ncbi:MAG: hypothetical protein HDQ89_03630 [Desulfovibrio sp.]|nr:hypothetical protein [Desulfovibrio sp.]
MPTIIHHSELVRRALIYLDEAGMRCPEKQVTLLLDEAGMRFNLSPAEAADLERLFRHAPCGPEQPAAARDRN